MNSPKMLNFINDTAKKTCVPPSLVLAEMQREAPRAFSWSDADFDMFSGVGWQATPTGSLNKDKGYCYNNNAQAMGIMQFLQPTFDHYVPQIPNIDGHPSPDRCNAMDSIVAGELKIKADSGTSANNCNGWDQATVYKVAGNYCGDHCTGPCYDANPPRWCSQQCGTNYCGGVYQFYQGYQAGLVCTLGGGTGGNQKLVQAMLSLDPRAYSPPNIGGFSNDLFCLRMVGDALAKAGYPVSQQLRVGLAYQAFGAAPVPPDKEINSLAINGVQDFAPGDLVDWIGGSAGHIGMVISVDNNAKFVYVASNLDSTHYPTRVTPYVWDAAHHTLNVAGGQYGVISPGYTLLGIIRTP